MKEEDLMKINVIQKIKNWFRVNRNSKNSFIRLGVRYLYLMSNILKWMKRCICDKEFRAIQYMKVFNSKRLQQTTSMTAMNRYPIIFSGCRDYFEREDNIRILSYGCSTGEEVLTLRYYFPNATIVGAEINEHSLKICHSHKADKKIKFIRSIPRHIEKEGPFDIVFCMAVLQRTPHQVTDQGITNLKKIYPFEKFEKQVIELDSYLKPGGLMVVHFSQYYFLDTSIASNYEVFGGYNQNNYRLSIFGKDSKLIKDKMVRYSIFQKKR